ncbi:MAG: hypothetical protein QNJ54_00805 [Prochloraceae cyanobacterium]|nr:hypothetical protein [Prochloraceae cyanobacterium]
MKPLTAAQKELYDYLVAHIDKFQYSPTIREMMRAMHLSSPAPIQARLGRLRSKGYIDWEEGQARTFKIIPMTQKGLPVCGAHRYADLFRDRCRGFGRTFHFSKLFLRFT